MSTAIAADPDRMECMEVWGGNRPVERSFRMPGLDVWISSRPIEESESGGDVYYLSSCASGRITRMLLADVSGHGTGVSGIAVALRDLMRQNVNMIRQNRFVQAMNRQFMDVAEQGTFATAVVATFFAPARSLAVSNAGHPLPMIYRAADNEWTVLEQEAWRAARTHDTPLGIVEQAKYSQANTRLSAGDMALFYTDGVIETELASGGLLGAGGLLKLVQTLNAARPEELLASLQTELARRAQRQQAGDDVSLLLCRATATPVGWRNNLLALGRFFRGVRDATSLRTPR